jgi:betaine-aldehyde dehydrogenase
MTTPFPKVRHHIGGAWQLGAGDDVVDVVNPATAETVTTFRSATSSEVGDAVAAARTAAPAWAALTGRDRTEVLYRLTDAVAAHLDELRDLEILDAGKPITAASTDEFPLILDSMRYFLGASRSLTTQTSGQYLPGVTTMFRREPVGVVAAITPWNYPLWLAVWKTLPALATGNTVVIKPAENTPLSTTRFVELAAALLPPGVLNLVHGRGATTGKYLAAHPGVDLVSFTGSVATGRTIAAAGADRPRRSVLELGGNAPVLILADADLPDAAATVAAMGTYNAGQECMAATRVIVAEPVADELIGLLLDEIAAVTMGDPTDPATTLGPLISEVQLARIEGLLNRLPDRAKVRVGGKRADRPGFYLEPTVITGVEQDDEIIQEEIFGPVITVQTFSEVDDGLAMANDVAFGLAGSVWTENIDEGLRLTSALQFGNVWLNTHLAVGPDFSLGGFRESGYGQEGGIAGIEEFTRVKAVGVRSRVPESAS